MGSILPYLLQKEPIFLLFGQNIPESTKLPDEKRAGLIVVIHQRSEANKN